MSTTTTTDTRKQTATRLYGRWLIAIYLGLAALTLTSIGLYSVGLFHWIDWLGSGLTGAWCQICDHSSGRIELIVAENSPAARAGVQTGDILILDDTTTAQPTTQSQADPTPYGEALPGGMPGDTVTITIQRPGGSEETVTLTRELGWNELLAGFTMLGVPGKISIGFQVAVVLIFVLGFIGVGLFQLWKMPGDRMAIIFSSSLILIGLTVDSEPRLFAEYVLPPFWRMVLNSIDIFAVIPTIMVLFTFPNGKLVPRWSKWVIVIFSIWSLLPLTFGHVYAIATATPVHPIIYYLGHISLFGTFFIGLGAQTYRYRAVSTPIHRQQAKWIMFGIALGLVAYFINNFSGLFVADPYQTIVTDTGILFWALSARLSILVLLAVPIAAVFAMLRYRLWDVDFVINRSLAYGGLTIVLGLIFIAGFLILRAIIESILGNEQAILAATLSTAIASASFNPARTRLQRFVDRRFYGIELDYARAIQGYDARDKASRQSADTQSTFGKYTSLKLLGRGGMGEVYQSYHPDLNCPVAIKLLPAHMSQDPESHQRFMREAQTIARLKHPNIVTLHEAGEQGGIHFMVLEYIDGSDLGQIIKNRGPLSLDKAALLLNDIATALDYAHRQGLVHRDIKPANVMIEAATSRAVLMDFGIARIATAITQLTGTGGMVGTLDYIAPEQIQGASEVDARADIYALGVMAYQMLTGELPFKHNNPGALVMAHLMQPPPDPRELVPGLTKSAAHVIIKAMAKKPEDRFATAGEMVAHLQ